MNQILRCDWLPKRARWRSLARSGLRAVSLKETLFFIPYNKSFTDQACSVSMAGFIGIHTGVIVYIFAHLHSTLRTEANVLGIY